LTQLHIPLVNLIKQAVEVNRNLPNFVTPVDMFGSSVKFAALDLRDRTRHPFKWPKDFRRPSQEQRNRRRDCEQESERDLEQCLTLCFCEWLLKKSRIEHAHAMIVAIQDRLIPRDVPVIDDKCAVKPRAALASTVFRTSAETRVPIARRFSNKLHVSADADIIEEQGDCTQAALRQARAVIDEVIDRIDECKVLIQKDTPTSAACRPSGNVKGLADWRTRPRVSSARVVAALPVVGTSSIRARRASSGDIAESSMASKTSMLVFDRPSSAELMIGQFQRTEADDIGYSPTRYGRHQRQHRQIKTRVPGQRP